MRHMRDDAKVFDITLMSKRSGLLGLTCYTVHKVARPRLILLSFYSFMDRKGIGKIKWW